MKKHFIIFPLLALSLTACSNGVSQNEYNRLKSEYEILKEKNTEMESEYAEVLQQSDENSSSSLSQSDTSFDKVANYAYSNLIGSTVTGVRVDGQKLLYITTLSGADSKVVGSQIDELLNQYWFDYDHVLWTQYVGDAPRITIWCDKDRNSVLSHVWDEKNEEASESENETTESMKSDTESESQPETFSFTPGSYLVGKDIPSGVYNVVKEDGIGSLTVRDKNDHLKEIVRDSYNNLKLESDYTFEISTSAKYSLIATEQ
ncbi:hypothetical protein [[Clostridium] symbiosum]|jgi:hypothetical protein|uniref:hypothetical protein n=1 Tax=Clostridium symbiosum TaxID=1512 RepID=UPI0006C79EE9|nr:hypothetical protein [[Clostridium] symbiosum]MDB2010674.1 hypothetical protein [[Clostridium] symbiosum]MDB2027307.1 hypothetical protein [[Clostridium] symbiosum]